MKKLLALLAAGALALSLAGPAAAPVIALTSAPVDDDWDGIDDALEQYLAEMYAPVVFMEPEEPNYPTNVDWILRRASLWYHEDCWFDPDESVPMDFPIDTQDWLLGQSWLSPWTHPDSFGAGHDENGAGAHCGDPPAHRRISTVARDPDGEGPTGYSDQTTFFIPDLPSAARVGSLDPLDWVTYFHAYPTSEGGIMLQYWHTFAYNMFPAIFDDHGGDWDATIHVQLDGSLNLKGVWFSRHQDDAPGTFYYGDGAGMQPSQLTMFDNTHTIMTIDGGGHAAFASPMDWCIDPHTWGFPSTGYLSDIAWTSSPTDPASLRGIQCEGVPGSPFYKDERGGTIWQTWTGGQVLQGGRDVDISIVRSPSSHGGLVNLGEYNPCTAAFCQGARQASTLLAGLFLPLNGQLFIAYSGRWGNVQLVANGPRGPVFQGFRNGVYTAWYNQGADLPASPATSPWRLLPETYADFTPVVAVDGRFYVSQQTEVSLTVIPYPIAARFGPSRTFYRFYRVGSPIPAWTPYSGPFSIYGPDGAYGIEFYSIDALNNVEPVSFFRVYLDGAPPVTSASLAPSAPNGSRGWYNSDVTVTLSPADPPDADGMSGSGVIGTDYRINGEWWPWQDYNGPFTVSTESSDNLVEFYSWDAITNIEQVTRAVRFKLDKTRPGIAVAGGELDGIYWPPERFTRGVITNDDILSVQCLVIDNLALQEVRAVDARPPGDPDSQRILATEVLAQEPPLTSSDCLLNGLLGPGINAIDLVVEDSAGWTRSTRIGVVFVEPGAHDPHGIGFWHNAVHHGFFTTSQFRTFLGYINVASDVFGANMKYGSLTLDNYMAILVPKKATAEDREKAQLLAAWLNLASGFLPPSYGVAMGDVPAWSDVVNNTGGNITSALNIVYEVEEINAAPLPARAQLGTAKDLLEGINSGALLDVDRDGLPDVYEDAHECLDPFTPDAYQDPDGDGTTNLQERAAGTNPCDYISVSTLIKH